VEHTKRMKKIDKLFKDYDKVPVLIVQDGDEALSHAKAHGFIS